MENLQPGLSFVFDGLPLPPSSNAIYSSFVAQNGKVRHVGSAKLKDFKVRFQVWVWSNILALRAASAALSGQGPLGIHCEFRFDRAALYTKDGRLKKMDVSNRLKAIHDAMSEALGIDDSLFVEISAKKVVGESGVSVSIYLPSS